MSEEVIEFKVGRFICGTVRDFLESCKFKGFDISYIESSGWIVRTFTIKGSREHIIIVNASIIRWSELNDKG